MTPIRYSTLRRLPVLVGFSGDTGQRRAHLKDDEKQDEEIRPPPHTLRLHGPRGDQVERDVPEWEETESRCQAVLTANAMEACDDALLGVLTHDVSRLFELCRPDHRHHDRSSVDRLSTTVL